MSYLSGQKIHIKNSLQIKKPMVYLTHKLRMITDFERDRHMELKRNKSKKREAIYDALARVTCHPTAEMLYESLKDDYPELSLGTVYRNLTVLEEEGRVISVSHEGGHAHYDARTEPHAHFICRNCQSVLDLDLSDKTTKLYKCIEDNCGFKVESHSLCFTGLCENCLNK